MLNIQKDELIHSFIFRMHIINEVKTFDNIISKDGRWTCYPRVKRDAVKYLKTACEIDIYNSLCSINLSQNETNILKSAKNNYGYLRYFYALDRSPGTLIHRCIKIRLCTECINESIVECGFGYFLSDWYRANYCTKHHIALIEVEAHNRSDAIQLISSVLRGDKIINSEEAKNNINFSAAHIITTSNNKAVIARTKNSYLAPCSVKIMMRFVLEHGIDATEEKLTFSQMNNIKENIEAKARIKGIVEGPLFRFLLNHDFRGFKSHWEKSTESAQVDYGIFTKGKLVETIIKDKKLSCKHCDLECDYGPFVSSKDQLERLVSVSQSINK